MSDRIMLKQGTHYHATEDGFIEIAKYIYYRFRY
jgi:hypothetical protein